MSAGYFARSGSRGLAVAAITILIAGGAVTLVTAPAQAAPQLPQRPGIGDRKLDKQDRSLLSQARAKGQRQVTLLVAARRGQSAKAATELVQLGGVVRKTDVKTDYLRVLLPTAAVEKAAGVSAVAAVDLSQVIPLEDPRPDSGGTNAKDASGRGATSDGATAPTPQAPPSATTGKVNPYLPIWNTGAPAFTAAHPTWDGRGVNIGIIDTGVDLSHPALQKTTTGERKIVDWITSTDPVGDGDPTWLKLSTGTFGAGTSFSFDGRTWVAPPRGGPFAVALFAESGNDLSAAGSELAGDVNRDGDTTDTWGVIQDVNTKAVYVDTNQNLTFADEKAMVDYKVKYDIGTFGADNPATGVREAVPFVVQTNVPGYVNLGIVSNAHGTHVAGIAAANGLFGGKMTGAAPGSKITSVRVCKFSPGCTSFGLVEGMIAAARSGVDVINLSIGGLPALNDGNNARAELYSRIIADYQLQLFVSAGNEGPGLNTVGDPAVTSDVIGVGSYLADSTWVADYGSSTTQADNLQPYSSRGPREDGGFKPDLVAPGAAISSIPTWQAGSPVVGTYPLPAGYGMFNGTSMATPQATGAAALLVGAYKSIHAGTRPVPRSLRTALKSSARFLPKYSAYEQGAGLVNVTAAWALLAQPGDADEVTASVEVHTKLSQFLAVPDTGVGIYDREGITVGEKFTRTYTLTRTTGAAGPVTYLVSWRGNDGTFGSASRVVLARGVPTAFEVKVNAKSAGARSAILRLDNPTTPGIDHQTMNTVITTEPFTAANGYTLARSGQIGRNQSKSFFFAIPDDTPAFKVALVGGGAAGQGQVRFLRFHPYGVGIEDNSTPNCYNPPAGGTCEGSPSSRTVTDPQAGVWEVTVEARRTSDVLNAPFTLTASILGVTVTPNPDVIATVGAGVAVNRSYTLTNSFGSFAGRAEGTLLGSARIARPSLANAGFAVYDVPVVAGSSSLRATIGDTSDAGADLDIYLYNCTTGNCVLASFSADGDSEESVTITGPAAGLWKVLVDGFSVPSGSTDFDYLDLFIAPSFGSVAFTGTAATHPGGSSWSEAGTVTANTEPGAGRVLYGQVVVRTTDSAEVGSGEVLIQAVT